MEYILAFDIGTTGVKGCLFDKNLGLLEMEYVQIETVHSADGGVFQKPEEWWQAIVQSTRMLVEKYPRECEHIVVIGVDGHMNGCVPVDTKGQAIGTYAPLWADFRAKKEADVFRQKIAQEQFYEISGCSMDLEIYPATKIRMLKNNEPDMYKRTAFFIGTKDYINAQLTKVVCTDKSDASNSGLFDLLGESWSPVLIDAAGIDGEKLPPVHASTTIIGELSLEASNILGLKSGIAVIAGSGDVPAASAGAGSYSEGVPYCNLGSAGWLAHCYQKEDFLSDKEYMPFVLHHVVDGLLTSQVVSFSGGICFQWIVEMLARAQLDDRGFDEKVAAIYSFFEENQFKDENRSTNPLFLPYLRGGYRENAQARGAFLGLTLEHDMLDMIRAVQEGVAYDIRRFSPFLFGSSESYTPKKLRLIGGGARSKKWCQLFSDVCGLDVLSPPNLQAATARGIAAAAGYGVGLFDDFSIIDDNIEQWASFSPHKEAVAYHNHNYDVFIKAFSNYHTMY